MVNIICITDQGAAIGVTVYMALVVLILMGITIIVYNQSLVKQEEIQTPNEATPWDKTYCILSLFQVRCVQFFLVVVLLGQLQVFVDLAMGPAFTTFFFNSNESLDDKATYPFFLEFLPMYI